MMNEKKCEGGCKPEKVLFALSVAATLLSGYVSLTGSKGLFGLAGTQWILVGIVLGVYAIYAHFACKCGKSGAGLCVGTSENSKEEGEKK